MFERNAIQAIEHSRGWQTRRRGMYVEQRTKTLKEEAHNFISERVVDDITALIYSYNIYLRISERFAFIPHLFPYSIKAVERRRKIHSS